MKRFAVATAVLLVTAAGTALAQSHPAPPPPRPAPPPASRPAYPSQPLRPTYQSHAMQPQQQPHTAPQFNLNHDLHSGYYRPTSPVRPANGVVVPPPAPPHRVSVGPVIRYPSYNPNPWNWNRGVVWVPSPAYWGGGFWGPFAFGLGFAPYGAYLLNGYTYDSYQAVPDSPGADLLAAYGLTQTPCGPPNLVVIWGPDGSVICAFPNNLVAPGEYAIDPGTLTLISTTAPPAAPK